MLKPAPLGSVAWWIRHELRLVIRELLLDMGPAAAFVGANLLLGLYLLLHGVAFVILLQLPQNALRPGGVVDVFLACAACVLAGIRGTATAFRMVHARRDGDLYLASPVPMARLAAARVAALVAAGAMVPLFWLSPLANVRALLDGPRYLAFYPALAGLSATIAALGALAVLRGVARIGKERLHALSRVLALLVLAAAIALRSPLLEGFLRTHAAIGAAFLTVAGSLASAFSGNTPAVLGLLACGGAGLASMPSLVAGGLSASLARAVPAAAPARPAPLLRSRAARLLSKEWRQLWRERSLLGQILFSLVLASGAVMLLARRLPGAEGAFAGATIVYAAGNLASDLAWLAVSGEQARWLLASSPNPPARLLSYKAIAAFVPAASIVVAAFAWIAFTGAAHGLAVLAAGLACCAGAVLFNVAAPTVGQRADAVFARRSRHRLLALADAGCCACWAATVVLPPALAGWKTGAALLAAAVPIALWGSRVRFPAVVR
jgi:ABC-2 type transport system permease protein